MFVFPNVLLTSTYWPSAITSLFSCLFPCFFFGSVWPPVEHADWYQLARSTWCQPGLKHKKKKKNKLAFSLRQRKKLKPGLKPCFSQWAPLEYTELDTILVETTTYFPLNVFLIFCQYVILYPPTGSLPVHRNRRLFGEEPQLLPRPLFLLFVNQDQNMYYFDRMYQCMYWKICWFSSTHTLMQ